MGTDFQFNDGVERVWLTYCLFNYDNIFGPFAFSYILIELDIGSIGDD